jgi:uncharacterized protein (DUF983 family)
MYFASGKSRKVTMSATLTRTPLTASDRCDRCGAAALVRVFLEGGAALQFCGHHFREHEVRLRSVAVDIQEELEKVSEK